MTRSKAIVARCRECAGTGQQARACPYTVCPLWRYRMGTEDPNEHGTRVTRGKAIREHCLWCCNGQRNEVKLCPAECCALYEYRMGRKVTDEREGERHEGRA